MGAGGSAAGGKLATPLSAPQARITAAALELFSENGVSGTSLQMIADAVGVTKAAVYHQFPSKEEIVVAAVEAELAGFEEALEAAEAGVSGRHALEVLLTQIIDLAVARRRMVVTLQHDPVVVRLLAEHEPFLLFTRRLFGVLTGHKRSAEARVRAAMIASAIGGAVSHPLVAGLGDETLRAQLWTLTRQFLEITG